jgi:hypothetical protein
MDDWRGDFLAREVVSHLIGRCLSFLIATYQKHTAASNLARLRRGTGRLLLRARAIVEDAETRHATFLTPSRGALPAIPTLQQLAPGSKIYHRHQPDGAGLNSRNRARTEAGNSAQRRIYWHFFKLLTFGSAR